MKNKANKLKIPLLLKLMMLLLLTENMKAPLSQDINSSKCLNLVINLFKFVEKTSKDVISKTKKMFLPKLLQINMKKNMNLSFKFKNLWLISKKDFKISIKLLKLEKIIINFTPYLSCRHLPTLTLKLKEVKSLMLSKNLWLNNNCNVNKWDKLQEPKY